MIRGFPDTKSGRKFQKLLMPDSVAVAEKYVWIFELITPYKNDQGQARQRTKYLGSLRDEYVDLTAEYPYQERALFWRGIISKLAELRLDGGTRRKLRDEIAVRVPLPTGEQLDEERERRKAKVKALEAAGVRLIGYRDPRQK